MNPEVTGSNPANDLIFFKFRIQNIIFFIVRVGKFQH